MPSGYDPAAATRRTVTAHYGRHGDVCARIRDALPAVGGDPDRPTFDALHRLDQFHIGGPSATRELAETAGLRDGAVLDLGCGVGGPARMLAQEYGCTVTGVDLTESSCASARTLSAWVGLDARTRFVCASVDALPFASGTWSWAWSQHAIMTIPDTPRMYAEIARVLRPGGVFVHHDVVAGRGGAPFFPVPWASEPAGSYLQPPQALRDQMEAAGLVCRAWTDLTEAVRERTAQKEAARAAGTPEAPGPHLVQGPGFDTMRANLARNLREWRVGVVRGVWMRPA
jgi:ubiquinone/menaquinone biosynthesis C-methylase UbiE